MPLPDRVLRSLFVAVAVGLGWGIRGDFGHMLGASYPGAILGLAFAYVSGQEALIRRMPVMSALTAIGIGSGGAMSYGILHGYAQSDTFVNYAYGYFTLFLQGGCWGCFGGAMLGLLLEEERSTPIDWIGGFIVLVVVGNVFQWIVVSGIGFDVNSPRSNAMIGFVGGVIGVSAWLAYRQRMLALRGAMLGFIGFGLGMSGGRLVGNMFHNLEGSFGINHWNTMEVSVGLIGGFIFAFGMLGLKFPERPNDKALSLWDAVCATYVLGLIPLFHLLLRVVFTDKDKVGEWTQNLESWGATWTAQNVMSTLYAVVALGFLGAASWLNLHATRAKRFGWTPVIGLSLVMLLYQNTSALYFFYPRTEDTVNMHSIFWVLFGSLVAYTAIRERLGGHKPALDDNADSESVRWRPWAVVTAATLAVIVFAAGSVNGDITMKTANTRWPEWSWSQGAFPGTSTPK